MNAVRRRLGRRPEEWKWSSYHEYAGIGAWEQEKRCGLTIDPAWRDYRADEKTRIWKATDLQDRSAGCEAMGQKSRSPWKTGLRLVAWPTSNSFVFNRYFRDFRFHPPPHLPPRAPPAPSPPLAGGS